jgi:hypothetical protein
MTGCAGSEIARFGKEDGVEEVNDVRECRYVTVVKGIAVNADFLVLKPRSIEAERLLIALDARPMDKAIEFSAAVKSGECSPEGRTGTLTGRIIGVHSNLNLASQRGGVKQENIVLDRQNDLKTNTYAHIENRHEVLRYRLSLPLRRAHHLYCLQ